MFLAWPRGPRAALLQLLVLALLAVCSARAYLDYQPSSAGLYHFIGSPGAGGANPFYYPPSAPPPPPHPRGSATFLTPWDAAGAGAGGLGLDQVPGLYASRYAASALPLPALPLLGLGPGVHHGVLGAGPLWHAPPRPAHAQHEPQALVQHEPAQRFYSGRGRPAMIPTPYAKFSSGADKLSNNLSNNNVPVHPNALNFPEPGFYGRADAAGAPGRDGVQGLQGPLGPAYHDKAAVGFYGKPLT